MTVRSFVDTNVLVYADDRSAGSKREVARDLLVRGLRSRQGVLSLQVLQEYYATATKRLGIPEEAARSRVELLGRLDIVSLDLGDLLAAIDLHRLHSLAIWDALIVRAALISDCRVLFSEDMQHGRRFESLEIVDPFR
jgi:predicted nucleic acid-binding protein